MNNLVLICAIFPVLIFIATIYPAIASGDPKHCHRYNACYTIGYNDGYTDVQDGNSPAYACVGHSQGWCDGYNDGLRVGNGGTNIFYGQRSDQSANINIHGDNNKININQQVRDNGFTSGHESPSSVLPNCVILCLNSNIRIK